MEEEKPQPPDHQREPAEKGDADVPIYYNVTMFDEEEDDDVAATAKFWAAMEDRTAKVRQNRAVAAIGAETDEEMAHRLYMQELMEMEEWELRDFEGPSSSSFSSSVDRPSSSSSSSMDRPSSSSSSSMDRPSSSSSASMDRPSSSSSSISMDRPSSSSSSHAGAAAKTAAPEKFWAGTPPYATNARATGTSDFESIQDVESGTEFLGNSRIPGPLEALADKKIRVKRATTLPSASNGAGRKTTSRFMRPGPRDLAKDNDAAGSSSSSTQAQHDSVSTARRALLAEAGSEFNYAGLDEWHDNSWYDDEEEEEPEQVEVDVQGLTESLQSCRLRSEPGCNPSAAAAEAHELSLQDFCERWGVAPSDMHPDEPAGQSTRVPPLADHDIPTFYCGMCMDTLPVFDLFHGLPCAHTFCAPCMATCLQSRVGASELPITCPEPDCGGGVLLHPDKCKKQAIDYAAFGDWGAQLAESAISPNRRAYCLNEGCNLTMVETSGVAERVSAPCPECGHALLRKRGACDQAVLKLN